MNKFMIGKRFFAALAISAAFNVQPTCAVETTLINNPKSFQRIEEEFNEKFYSPFHGPKGYAPKTKYLTLYYGMGEEDGFMNFIKTGGTMEIEKKFLHQIDDAIGGLEPLGVDLSDYIAENPKKTIPIEELRSDDIVMGQRYAEAIKMSGCVVDEILRLTELKDRWTKECEMARQRKLSEDPKVMKLFTND